MSDTEETRNPNTREAGQSNLSLNRAASTGRATEDSLLFRRIRKKRAKPRARNEALAAFTHENSWRILRITSEFVHGFEALSDIEAAITIFGSARISEGDPTYAAARDLAFRLAKAGFGIITGGGPAIMEAALIPKRLRKRHGEFEAKYYAEPMLRPMGMGRDPWGLRRDDSEFPLEITLSPIHFTKFPIVRQSPRTSFFQNGRERLLWPFSEAQNILTRVR